MNFQNTLIRTMIKGLVITLMILSVPVKIFNMLFQWRENKQTKLIRKSNQIEPY